MSDDDFRVTRIRPVNGGGNGREPENPLEQIMNKIRGGGGGGGGGRDGKGGDANPVLFGGMIVLVLLLVWGGMSSFTTIEVEEEGVVTRFGKYNRTLPSGFHFILPFNVDRVIKVQSKRILQEDFGFRAVNTRGNRTEYEKQRYGAESLMLTGDLNVADVEWSVQYRINDPWKFLFHARDVQRNIRDVSMSIMRRVVGDKLVSEVLTTARVAISAEAEVLTQQVLDKYDLGVTIENIQLQGSNPPGPVKNAFNEVNAAKQEQEQMINNAEREYNKIIPEARGKAEQLIADARAYAIDVVNRAEGDASQFNQVLDAYKKAPDVTRRRLYLETMEEVFSQVESFTVVDDEVKGLLPIFNNQPAARQKTE